MENETKLETQYNIPSKSSQYAGEFVVFFSEDKDPKILFHSLMASEAYDEARKIEKEKGKKPLVVRIPRERESARQLMALCMNR